MDHQYPDHLTVIVSHFHFVTDPNPRAFSSRLVFLDAFATLTAVREKDGSIRFDEHVGIDGVGNRSIELLADLGGRVEPHTTVAGWRLHDCVSCLIRVPRDSDREEIGKPSLVRLGLALAQQPVDTCWYDNDSGRPTMRRIATAHGLNPPGKPISMFNPNVAAIQVAAQAATIWVALAERLIPAGGERRKAFASFDHFMSSKGG